MVKGRFAPSPTGRMHLGNALAALLSWLSARSRGGSWLLRHEDLDRERCPRRFAEMVEADLRRLGLDWDEGGLEGRGGAGPYLQSLRDDIYAEQFARIEALTYPCHCSRSDILSASAPHESDGRVVYPGTCRNAPRDIPGPASTRLIVPDRDIVFTDAHYGETSVNLARHCGDFIVRRKDGVWAYQFAVVVDDALMGVTEVVRGRDLLLSAAQQIYQFELLGFTPPTYAHFPLLCAPDGERLSKREGALDLDAWRSPEDVVGYLAWLSGLIDSPQACRPEELIGQFSWDKVPLEDIPANPSANNF